MRQVVRESLSHGTNSERGVVLAFLALVLFALIAFAGLAIDVGNWWWTGQKVQKAADAAAMAGVTHLPDDLPSAQATAENIAQRNGYTAGVNATIVSGVDERPTELRVTIETEVDNFFTSILGFDKTTIKRTAVADYTGAVPMGSPADYLGQDPEIPARRDNLWLSIASPGTDKANGDRYMANRCSSSTYRCGSGTPNNQEFFSDNAATQNHGYRFVVKVQSITPGQPLTFQIFDPAHVVTGLTCTDNMPSAAQVQHLQSTYSNHPQFGTFFNDAQTRYARDRNPYCTGDDALFYSSGVNAGDVAYIVRMPDDTPWDDTDNPVVSGCTRNFRPINTSLYKYLDPADPAFNWGANPNTSDAAYVREVFHRWVTVCTIPAGSAQLTTGDYIVQVRTNHNPSNPTQYQLNTNKGGASRFSIRAGFRATATSVPGGSNIQVHANGKLPLFVNGERNTTSTFYLARIMPSAAGRTLHLDFFDIGDVGTGAAGVSVQVIPPAEYGSTFANCVFRIDNGSASTSSNCSRTGMNSSTYQARLVSVAVPIPSNYDCNTSANDGCWVRIRMTFNNSSATNPTDVTTWTARVEGDPIRIVE